MRVIFLQNIKNVAQIGDIKNVSDGYARNFLLPNNLAKQATEKSQKEAELLKKKREATAELKKERALDLIGKLENVDLEISAEANEEGHLYGGINTTDISELLRSKKFDITEDEINLPKPIKTIGEHDIELEFTPEIKTSIKLKVIVKS